MPDFWPEPTLRLTEAFEKPSFFSMNLLWNLHLTSHTHWRVERIWLSYIIFCELNSKTRCFALFCQEVSVFLLYTCSNAHPLRGAHTPARYHTLPALLCFHPSPGSCLPLPIPFSDKSLLLLPYSYYYFCASHSSGQESFKNLNYFVARHGTVFLKVAFLFWIKFISYSVWFYEFAKSFQVLRNSCAFFSNTHTNIYKELRIWNNY